MTASAKISLWILHSCTAKRLTKSTWCAGLGEGTMLCPCAAVFALTLDVDLARDIRNT